MRNGAFCIDKSPVDGGQTLSVRCNAAAPAPSPDGTALYFARPLRRDYGALDWEVHRARPESADSVPLARIAASRVPVEWLNIHTIVSPDGKWLALPLRDGATSNLWLIGISNGAMHRVTDFGDRSTIIGRRISWSPDGKALYAAVADTDADVVLLDGLLR
jgi:hypothetical protein